MTRMLNVVQQQWIASLASVNLVMREMVLPVKVSMKLHNTEVYSKFLSPLSYEQTDLAPVVFL